MTQHSLAPRLARLLPAGRFCHLSLLLPAALLFATTPAQADIYVVECGESIQDAVDLADDDPLTADTIVVHPCTYVENVAIGAGLDGLHLVAAQATPLSDPTLVGAGPSGVGAAASNPRPRINGSGLGPCIKVVDSSRVAIEGFMVYNCAEQGIRADNVQSLKLHDNVINGFFGKGIEINTADAPSITSNWVVQTSDHGIHLTNVEGSLVADNTIMGLFGPTTNGILLDLGCQRNHLVRNHIQGVPGPGIHEMNGAETRIDRNTTLSACQSMPVIPCVCDQIVVGAGAWGTDLVGNHTNGGGIPNIDLCSPSAQAEENY